MNDEIRMTNDDLPDGWATCEIGEISPVIGGGTPPSKNPHNFTDKGGIPWITPADLSGYSEMFISRGKRNLTERGFSESSARMLPKGALLFSSRAPVGYVAIASNPVCTNQGFKSFILPEGFDSRFGYFYLRHIKPLAEARATGTTFKELSGGAASHLPFNVAPLSEQRRIADKLEAVLGRVDACRTRLDRIPALLKRFRQSVLAAATSGHLTAEWRMANGLDDEWESAELGSLIADGPKNGLYKSSTCYGQGTRILRIDNFYAGYISSWEGLKRLTVSEAELEDFSLAVGDIVVNRVNSMSHLGKSALVRDLPEPCVFESNMMRLRLDIERISPQFCILVLTSQNGIEQLQQNAKQAVNQASINQTDVKAVIVSLPSLPEQQEIVRRVEALIAIADRIEVRLATAHKTVERLTPATLAKAFRGELIPQDPNDESASVLLERIREERESFRNPRKRNPSIKV